MSDQLTWMAEQAKMREDLAQRLREEAGFLNYRLSSLALEAAAAIEELARDAVRWREHAKLVQMSGIEGVLRIRLSQMKKGTVWEIEALLDAIDLYKGPFLPQEAVAMRVREKYKELAAAIDAAQAKATGKTG